MRAPDGARRLRRAHLTAPMNCTAATSRYKKGMTTRRELANAIRALSMDAVQRANSGHPGMPI